MLPEQNFSQNINITGGHLSNLQVGGQASRDLNVQQSLQSHTPLDSGQLSSSDILALLDQLQEVIQNSTLQVDARDSVVRNIEVAKEEVKSKEPDRDFVTKNLKKVAETLTQASETLDAGTGLWQKVQPVLSQMSSWLGVATSFFTCI